MSCCDPSDNFFLISFKELLLSSFYPRTLWLTTTFFSLIPYLTIYSTEFSIFSHKTLLLELLLLPSTLLPLYRFATRSFSRIFLCIFFFFFRIGAPFPEFHYFLSFWPYFPGVDAQRIPKRAHERKMLFSSESYVSENIFILLLQLIDRLNEYRILDLKIV